MVRRVAALPGRLQQAIGNCKGQPMNTDRRSWHLKVERAERQLEEVKSAMADYASRHLSAIMKLRSEGRAAIT